MSFNIYNNEDELIQRWLCLDRTKDHEENNFTLQIYVENKCLFKKRTILCHYINDAKTIIGENIRW